MPNQMTCDICGRTAADLPSEALAGSAPLELDADGLWVCVECCSELRTPVVAGGEDEALSAELRALAGQSAGAICRTLDLPYEPPYQPVIDAAAAIAYEDNLYMSAWTFVALWLDGTTVWRSPEGNEISYRTPAGSLRIETR